MYLSWEFCTTSWIKTQLQWDLLRTHLLRGRNNCDSLTGLYWTGEEEREGGLGWRGGEEERGREKGGSLLNLNQDLTTCKVAGYKKNNDTFPLSVSGSPPAFRVPVETQLLSHNWQCERDRWGPADSGWAPTPNPPPPSMHTSNTSQSIPLQITYRTRVTLSDEQTINT